MPNTQRDLCDPVMLVPGYTLAWLVLIQAGDQVNVEGVRRIYNKPAYPNLPNDGRLVFTGTGEEQATVAPRDIPDFVSMDGQDGCCHSRERRLVALVVCV
jgi:hypothetical protein